MSKACKLKTNTFVGVSLFSPHYEAKARRLLASCERVQICCKATLLPSDVYGPGNPTRTRTRARARTRTRTPNPNQARDGRARFGLPRRTGRRAGGGLAR